jgi:hypothetical protein
MLSVRSLAKVKMGQNTARHIPNDVMFMTSFALETPTCKT